MARSHFASLPTHFGFCSFLICLLIFPVSLESARGLSAEVSNIDLRRIMISVVVHQSTGLWCIARSSANDSALQSALDWACGPGPNQGNVDCTAISAGGQCYTPDTLSNHASYAFNSYFQKNNQAAQACNFNNCAQTTSSDPSTGSCSFASSSSLLTTNVTSSPGFTSPGTTTNDSLHRASAQVWWIFLCVMATMLLSTKL